MELKLHALLFVHQMCCCFNKTDKFYRSFTYRTATRRPVYNLVSDLDEAAEAAHDEVDVDSTEEHFM